MSAAVADPAPARPVERPAGDAGHPRRTTAAAAAVYLALQGVLLALLRLAAPRFFWLDDQQAQYLPVFSWFGRHLRDGRPPLLDPELGASGNYLADPQYGALDPVHWGLAWVVGRMDGVLDAAWLLGGGAVTAYGLGVVFLLRRYGASAPLAVAAALGVAGSGFALWFGSSWWPLLWSTAWLPWLWLGVVSRRWPGVLVTGLAAYLLGGAGYPYHLVVAGVLVASRVVEHLRHGPRAERRAVVVRVVAAAGGLLASSASLLAAAQMSPSTQRVVPRSPAGNTGAQIPNLLDTVLGGATLAPSVSGTWANDFLHLAPIAATAVFAVPALALVDWRTALRRPGVLTAVLTTVAALVLTQLPTHVGPFRYPFRYLAVVELALPVLAVVALLAAPCLTRSRVRLAAGLVGAQVLLALLRAPVTWPWHLLAGAAGLAALGALVTALRSDRGPVARRAAAVVLVAASVAAPVVGHASAVALGRADAQLQGLEPDGSPARQLPRRTEWGVAVDEYRGAVVATDRAVTVPAWGSHGPDGGWARGLLVGNANLLAGLRPGFGYIASGHREWAQRWCADYLGTVDVAPRCVTGLLRTVPGTDLPWVDALSTDEILLSRDTPRPIRRYFAREWDEGERVGRFRSFRRPDPVADRVISASPEVVRISSSTPGDDPAYAGSPLEVYRVSTDDDGELLLRIPWWPGLTATVDGRPVPLSGVAGTVTRVVLPGGLDDAELEVAFEPLGARLLAPTLAVGLLIVLAAAAAERRAGRRTAGGGRPEGAI